MKRFVGPAIALAGALAFAAADAQTLRWASAGDPQTMDPHSQNESMTNMMNGQVYERLTRRDRELKIVPGLATEWQQVGPLTWRFKLRQGVKFHDGSPLTADDVVYLGPARPDADLADQQLRGRGRHREEGRRVDDRVHARRGEPDLPRAPRHALDHEQDLEREEQGHAPARLQEQGRELRRAQRQRHRPLHAGEPRAGHQDDLQAQPELLGQGRRQRPGSRLHADQQRRDPAGGAGLGRGRFRPRPGAARHPAAAQHRRREGRRRAGEPGRLHRHGPGPRRIALQQRQGQEPVQGRARPPRAVPGDRHRDAEEQAHERAELPDRRGDAVAARHLQRPGARAALSVRSRRREKRARRGRLPRRLRGHAPLPEQPLRQRRADLHRPGRHVGADQGQGARSRASRARPTSRASRSTTSACTCSAGAARSPTPRRR